MPARPRGRQKLEDGDFNILNVEHLPGEVQKITLVKDGEKKVYRWVAKDLYSPQEQLVDYEEIDLE